MLYLASRSPQRAMLLTRAGIAFTVVDSTCDEESVSFPNPQVLALERARAKAAAAVLSTNQRAGKPAVVLGADTVVALGQQVFGKPADRADAVRILSQLQGTTHTVYTGHCCLRLDTGNEGEASRIAMTRVTMRAMSAQDIEAYVASGESDGRAGAYAIQETGDRFVAEMQGSWDTVVGLNVAMSARLYLECTESWPDGYRA
ncbi:MAG TPA: Maf family protein [Planctomycetota bacterium]|nr:Maf family protein [Planctomycetota bacterium]